MNSKLEQDIIDTLEELSKNSKVLEDSVINVVSQNKSENDLVLKELTSYLNMSAQQLKQLNSLVNQISTATSIFSSYSTKLDNIENKSILLPQELFENTNKINQYASELFNKQSKILLAVYNSLKKMDLRFQSQEEKSRKIETSLVNISSELKNINDELRTNQKITQSMINKMIDGNLAIAKNNVDLKKTELESNSNLVLEEKKQKWDLKTKVILAFVSSGGILFIIVQAILAAISGKPPTP